LDEKFFLKEDSKILKGGLPTDSGTLVAWLINVSGREACGPIKQPEKVIFDKKSAPKKQQTSGPLSVEPWSDLALTDIDGKEIKLSSRWTNNRAVVSLLRRFG